MHLIRGLSKLLFAHSWYRWKACASYFLKILVWCNLVFWLESYSIGLGSNGIVLKLIFCHPCAKPQ